MRPLKPDKNRFVRIIRRFKGKRILVVGDVMLDLFVWGSVRRISPEAPVPVVEIKGESSHLGGAANVAFNIWSLTGSPLIVGVVGDDYAGKLIQQEIKKFNNQNGLVVDKQRITTVKTRIVAHHQQICRTDREDMSEISEPTNGLIIRSLNKLVNHVDAIIVSDYAKGVINKTVWSELLMATKKSGVALSVDPKVKNFPLYKEATVITPNQHEAEQVSETQITDESTLIQAGKKILAQAKCQHLLITRGEEGMTLFENSGGIAHIPTVAREVFDVTGAGDTVISALTLSLISGASITEAAVIANHAAGIVVGKLGTASVTPAELINYIEKYGAGL